VHNFKYRYSLTKCLQELHVVYAVFDSICIRPERSFLWFRVLCSFIASGEAKFAT